MEEESWFSHGKQPVGLEGRMGTVKGEAGKVDWGHAFFKKCRNPLHLIL